VDIFLILSRAPDQPHYDGKGSKGSQVDGTTDKF